MSLHPSKREFNALKKQVVDLQKSLDVLKGAMTKNNLLERVVALEAKK